MRTTIYTKEHGKLATWGTDCNSGNYGLAIEDVRKELPASHKAPILILFDNTESANDELPIQTA